MKAYELVYHIILLYSKFQLDRMYEEVSGNENVNNGLTGAGALTYCVPFFTQAFKN